VVVILNILWGKFMGIGQVFKQWLTQRVGQHVVVFGLMVFCYPLLTVFYQSCEGFQPASLKFSSLNTGKIDPECLSKGEADACIYLVNPVATLKKPIGAVDEYEQAQIYAIELPPGPLTNQYVSIEPSSVARATPLADGSWRYKASENPSAVEQIHIYYWSSLFLDQMIQSLGDKLNIGRPIVIDSHSGNTTDILVNSGDNTVKVGRALPAGTNKVNEPVAASAEAVVESLAYILATRLNPSLESYPSSTHSQCVDPLSCSCVSAEGCGASLVLGAAILFRHEFFIQHGHTAFGDSIINDYGAAQYCGLKSDLAHWTPVTMDVAFTACTEMYDQEAPNSYSLALVFAAVWAPLMDPTQTPGVVPSEVLDLLAIGMGSAQSNDNFTSFFRRVIELDRQQFAGHYGPLLRERLSLHGVQL
jgi:hypothetical protein